ncbi:MAG TPA: 16S rRNA (guanine(966)-N(2))-methyltransferase RsmD [Burkholderiales bacterium]|nr:16S rRNA (guanine(966)-N(2))-methyltransferase RsmD [Burkholderiales bacterium]
MHLNKGKIRIIAGEYRGRRIPVAQKPDLRPTPDRVRETLFNWLGQRLDGLACLDLFAGSGALGFEAASRGAARVVMVENDAAVFRALEEFRALVGAKSVELARGDAFEYIARSRERFDVVFLDPPFRQNALPAVFRQLIGATGMRVYVESNEPFVPAQAWEELKRARAGQVSYQLFQWRGDDQGGLSRDV